MCHVGFAPTDGERAGEDFREYDVTTGIPAFDNNYFNNLLVTNTQSPTRIEAVNPCNGPALNSNKRSSDLGGDAAARCESGLH